jgi:3',5'-cyclic AMP phosphodiesterase CpdA
MMFRLAHISDIHLGPMPRVSPAELLSKRITGYVNWQRNRRKHLFGNTLEQVLAGVRDARPDHVAITGDLVNLATRAEIEAARLWLETHFDPANTTLVPGNHDAYVPGALERSTSAWQPWMLSDPGSRKTAMFPAFRKRGPVALIGLSTANATLPFMATGTFGNTQAKAAGKLLDQAGRDGLFRVVMIHHPPVRNAARWHKRMKGIGRFAKMLKRHGAELVLHGHTHLDTISYLPGKDGRVPVLGIASASQGHGSHKPAAGFNLFEIDGGPGDWNLVHKRMRLAEDGAGLGEIKVGLVETVDVNS